MEGRTPVSKEDLEPFFDKISKANALAATFSAVIVFLSGVLSALPEGY